MNYKRTYLTSALGLVIIFVTALIIKTGLLWIIGVGMILFLLLIRTFQGEISFRKESVFSILTLIISLLTLILMILNNNI